MIAALLALTSFVSCSGLFNKDDDTVTPLRELAGTYWTECEPINYYYDENNEKVYTEDFVYEFNDDSSEYLYFKDESTVELYSYDSDTESFKLENTSNYEWIYYDYYRETHLDCVDLAELSYNHGSPDASEAYDQVDSFSNRHNGERYYYYGTTAPTKAVNSVDAELVKASN